MNRDAALDVLIGLSLGLFAGGAVAAVMDATVGALLIGAACVCAVASIEIGRMG